MEQLDKLKFEQLEQRFSQEFNDTGNKQILFSGPFGSGKTTFLRDFATNNPDTTFIHIYPVNYSLHSNTDIYEILKFDIILELIGLGQFKEEDISSILKYSFALSQTVDGAIKKLLNLFSKTGKQLVKLQEILKESVKQFSKTGKDLTNPLLGVAQFGEETESLKGYEYEDFITSIIKEKLNLIDGEVVLIVDDLDTIDPEHLFRLISIFRAHIDHHTNDNKFEFDKIIFVGDVNNIRAMYAHRFGSSESFAGYISKLSSKDIFYFNPAKELYINLNRFLLKVRFTIEGASGELTFLQNSADNVRKLALYLVANLVNIKVISLRDLQKENVLSYGNAYIQKYDSYLYDLDIYAIRCLLIYYIGSATSFKSIFERVANNPIGLNKIFYGIRNYGYLYADFSAPFLEAISYLPEFKEKKENDTFELNVDGKLFKILTYRPSMSRKPKYRVSDETVSARDFFYLASYCLIQFEEIIFDN